MTFEIREYWLDARDELRNAFIGSADSPEQAKQIILECPLAAHRLAVTMFDATGNDIDGFSGDDFLAAIDSLDAV